MLKRHRLVKYKTLKKVVMACLALPDVERGFSANKRLVTADRACLGEQTVNAVRLVKDYMRTQANCQAVNVAVTPALLCSARSAYSRYKEFLEEEKKKEEGKKERLIHEQQLEAEEQKKRQEKRKKEMQRQETDKLTKEEGEITAAEKEQHNLLSGSGALLKEAETKLAEAIRAGNMDNISIAHGLLEVARCRMNAATKTLSKMAEKRQVCLQKKKRHLDMVVYDKAAKVAKPN